MNRKLDIEARLERSLKNQVRAPKLDGRFDAAVWARIQGEAAKSVAPQATERTSSAPRWLFASNVAAAVVAVVLVLYFGSQAMLGSGVQVEMPRVSPGFVESAVGAMIWPVTGLALAVGLMFTSFGRRLRSEFF